MAHSVAIARRQAAHKVMPDRFRAAYKVLNSKLRGPQFDTDADGYKIRIWDDVECCLAPEVVSWLRGLRMVEDLREGLEFVKQGTIDRLVRDKHLVKASVGGGYYVSAKCAEHYGLGKFMPKGFKWLV